MNEILDKIISSFTELISIYPYKFSIIFIAWSFYLLIFKIPKIKPFLKEKTPAFYRELFLYYLLVFTLFVFAMALLLKNL